MVARLKTVEKRHKVSFTVESITHFISHVIFLRTSVSRNGSFTLLCARTRSTDLDF